MKWAMIDKKENETLIAIIGKIETFKGKGRNGKNKLRAWQRRI